MTKKSYLEPFKKFPGSLYFRLLEMTQTESEKYAY